MTPSPPEAAVILVVDDQPINRELLQRRLTREGMSVRLAENGVEALKSVEEQKPDLILLDVMMPEMDGIEVCQRLQADPETQDIPILFVTARDARRSRLEGLNVGAVDYITKPVDLDETMARVRTQLNLKRIYRENLELQQRLEEMRKAAAVGAVTQGVAHNLNNLLGVVCGYLDLLKIQTDDPAKVRKAVGLIDQSVRRMVEMIRKLSSIAYEERFAMTEEKLVDLVQNSIRRFRNESGHKEAEVEVDHEVGSHVVLRTNPEVFESIVSSLLTNAWEAYPAESDEDRLIILRTRRLERGGIERLAVEVLDEGTGLHPEVRDNLFDAFITTKVHVGRGLGLTMARHAARNLGAEIEVRPRETGGVCARLLFKLAPKA